MNKLITINFLINSRCKMKSDEWIKEWMNQCAISVVLFDLLVWLMPSQTKTRIFIITKPLDRQWKNNENNRKWHHCIAIVKRKSYFNWNMIELYKLNSSLNRWVSVQLQNETKLKSGQFEYSNQCYNINGIINVRFKSYSVEPFMTLCFTFLIP